MAHTLTLRKTGEIERDEHDCLEDGMAFAAEEIKWESTECVRLFDDDGSFAGDYLPGID